MLSEFGTVSFVGAGVGLLVGSFHEKPIYLESTVFGAVVAVLGAVVYQAENYRNSLQERFADFPCYEEEETYFIGLNKCNLEFEYL